MILDKGLIYRIQLEDYYNKIRIKDIPNTKNIIVDTK